MISKIVFLLFGLVANVCLLHTTYNLILFLSAQSLRENDLETSTLTLITIDVCLVVLFMAQHSGLATSVFRDFMKFFYLQPITRALYTLLTALSLQFMMSKWQTIGEVQFWYINTSDQPLLWLFFHILHWTLWILTFLQVLVMAPLELSGLRQVLNFIRDVYPTDTRFHQLLHHMPHPGSGCFVALLWIHPCMTFDRMILATVLTAYLCTGFSVTKGDYSFLKSYTTIAHTTSTARVQRSLRRQ